MRRVLTAFLAAALLTGSVLAVTAAGKPIPAPYKNCTQLNKKYPHGVGKVGARDHTTGVPVTNFKRSNNLYAVAMKFNKGLDRDHDGIACEKA